VHAQVAEHPAWHVNIWTGPNAPYLGPAVVAEAVRLFDEAEKAAAADPVLAPRVAVARLPIRYTQIMQAGPETPDAAALVQAFEAVARKAGLTTIREDSRSGRLDTWLAEQRKRLKIGGEAKPADAPK
jgi:hypothetical protein